MTSKIERSPSGARHDMRRVQLDTQIGYNYQWEAGSTEFLLGDCNFDGKFDYVKRSESGFGKSSVKNSRYNLLPGFQSVTCRNFRPAHGEITEEPLLSAQTISEAQSDYNAAREVANEFHDVFEDIPEAVRSGKIKEIRLVVNDNAGQLTRALWLLTFADKRGFSWMVEIAMDRKGDVKSVCIYDPEASRPDILVDRLHADWIVPIEARLPKLRWEFVKTGRGIEHVSRDFFFDDPDGDADGDADGLANRDEARFGTNPMGQDSDNDGVDDKTEVGPDPANPRDTDGDARIDALDEDDDGDGKRTWLELLGGTEDVDGDAISNYLDRNDTDGPLIMNIRRDVKR